MGENSMSMFCFIVLYVCAIADCLPFYDTRVATFRSHTTDKGGLRNGNTHSSKDVSGIYLDIGNKGSNEYTGEIADKKHTNAEFHLNREHDSSKQRVKTTLYAIVNYMLLKLHRPGIMNMENQTKTTIEISDENKTQDLVNLKSETNVISSPKRSSLTSNSVGFRRNSALVPGHRKRRMRRSFFLDFDLGDIFADVEDDLIFSAHTSPCQQADMHFCLNGGTCVFVGALGIKTCRCRIGYTGLRCEMINQEYILALIAADDFFG